MIWYNDLRGAKGVPRKGVWASVNMRVWACNESRAKCDQTSCYLRPPFLGSPLVPSRRTRPDQTRLDYTLLYHTILYHTIPYHTIPYHTILYYTILCYTILCYTILYWGSPPRAPGGILSAPAKRVPSRRCRLLRGLGKGSGLAKGRV